MARLPLPALFDLAFSDLEAQVADGSDPGVFFCELFNFDHFSNRAEGMTESTSILPFGGR